MKPLNTKFKLLTGLFLIFFQSQVFAQVINDRERITVTLKDRTVIVLYGKANDIGDKSAKENLDKTKLVKVSGFNYKKSVGPNILLDEKGAKDNEYYYLPTGLHLSKKPDGVPQFLFLKYVTDAAESNGGISGALLHFMMEWGLNESQKMEATLLLQKIRPGAKIMGPVRLEPMEGETFSIVSATTSDKTLTPTQITSGKAPALEGGKIAAAANLNKNGAQLLAATFEKSKSITDLSVNLQFKYFTRLPAVKGRITINWEETFKEFERRSAFAKIVVDQVIRHRPFIGSNWDEKITHREAGTAESQSGELSAQKACLIEIQEGYPSEATSKIVESFMAVFQDKISKMTNLSEDMDKIDFNAAQNRANGDTAIFRSIIQQEVFNIISKKSKYFRKTGTEIIELNYGMLVPNNFGLVGNLAEWYNGVKNNKNCIASVNLNDPFYKHLDIRFVLDLEAKEMFDQEVNYVTVNVKKKRDSGNPFQDRLTIDKKFLTDKGLTGSLTYAEGEDKNPEIYEYQAQWSLKGGNIFPPSPPWQKGSLEAVTLAPPITPRTVEFEANLEELKSSSISRVTLQVRYLKFGKEVEENIAVSPAKNEALTSKMIFTDRNTQGYVYRLIFNHTTEGKLALEWQPKVNDNYVYAVIPEQLKDKDSDIFKRAKEAAKTIVPPASDGTVTSDKVIDGFKEIFGIAKDLIKKN